MLEVIYLLSCGFRFRFFFVVACVKFMIMKSFLIRDELFCLAEKKNLKADTRSKHIDLFSLSLVSEIRQDFFFPFV